MASFSKIALSGSTNGRQIKVVPIVTVGTLIHTAIAGSSDLDEIWLWAYNHDTVARVLTIEYGGVASPDDLIKANLSPQSGLILIVPGLLLQNGLVVGAFAAAANLVMISGYVNRITA